MNELISQAEASGDTHLKALMNFKLDFHRHYRAEREKEGRGLLEILATLMARMLREIQDIQQDTFRRGTDGIEEAEAKRILDENSLRIIALDRTVHCLNEPFEMIEIMGAEEFLLYVVMEALAQPAEQDKQSTEEPVENLWPN
jgi:hypothetical protein